MSSISKLENLYEAVEMKIKQSTRSRDWETYIILLSNIQLIIEYLSLSDEKKREEFIENLTIN